MQQYRSETSNPRPEHIQKKIDKALLADLARQIEKKSHQQQRHANSAGPVCHRHDRNLRSFLYL